MANRDITNWRSENGAGSLLGSFYAFWRELDRLFHDFLVPGDGHVSGPDNVQPKIEITETQEAYTVTAELPGLSRKDIRADFKDNILIVAGGKKEMHSETEGGRHYTERSFERRIPFEDEVAAEKIEARFNNGVLTVILPKNPRARDKGRRIEIKS